MLSITIEKRMPNELVEIFHSIAFWNNNLTKVYDGNVNLILGSLETQKEAKETPIKEWELKSIYYDIQTIIDGKDDYICGLSGSHVWLSYKEGGQRIALITN
jgi:hypothetical protein